MSVDSKIVGGGFEITFEGELTEASGKALRDAIKLARGHKRLVLKLNSQGGTAEEAITVGEALEALARAGTEVRCEVDGYAMSAAFYILQSCQVRAVTERAQLMAHEPYFPILRDAKLDDLKARITELQVFIHSFAAHCAARMKVGVLEFKKRTRAKDWYMTAYEAIELGAADELLPSPNTKLAQLHDACNDKIAQVCQPTCENPRVDSRELQ